MARLTIKQLCADLEDLRVERQGLLDRITSLETQLADRGSEVSPAQVTVAAEEAPAGRPAHVCECVQDVNRKTYYAYVALRRAACKARGMHVATYDPYEMWVGKWMAKLVPVATEEVTS